MLPIVKASVCIVLIKISFLIINFTGKSKESTEINAHRKITKEKGTAAVVYIRCFVFKIEHS